MILHLIDYRATLGGEQRYITEVLKALRGRNPPVCPRIVSHGAALERYRNLDIVKALDIPCLDLAPANAWGRNTFARLLLYMIRRWWSEEGAAKLSLSWMPSYFMIPAQAFKGCQAAWFPRVGRHRIFRPPRIPLVGTIPDITYFHFPDLFPRRAVREEWVTMEQWIDSSAALVSISMATATDVCARFQSCGTRVKAIPLCSEHALHLTPASKNGDSVDPLPVHSPYVIYPASTSPHKNHEMLFQAMAALPKRIPLVLTGEGTDLSSSTRGRQLKKLAEKWGLSVGRDLVALGMVEESHYWHLVRRSSALVFPSLAEGFGLPVGEALQWGVPIICSDIPALREQVNDLGGTVTWCPASTVGAWTAAISKIHDEKKHHNRTDERRNKPLGGRCWRDVAEEYLAVFDAVGFNLTETDS